AEQSIFTILVADGPFAARLLGAAMQQTQKAIFRGELFLQFGRWLTIFPVVEELLLLGVELRHGVDCLPIVEGGIGRQVLVDARRISPRRSYPHDAKDADNEAMAKSHYMSPFEWTNSDSSRVNACSRVQCARSSTGLLFSVASSASGESPRARAAPQVRGVTSGSTGDCAVEGHSTPPGPGGGT